MAARIASQFYVPRTKAGLIKAILPMWIGPRTAVREMSVKRLRFEFKRLRQEAINKVMSKRD